MKFEATAKFDVSHLDEGLQAGITAYAAPLNHYDVIIERCDGKLLAKSNIRLGEVAHTDKQIAMTGNVVYLQLSSDKDYYYMKVSNDGKNYETLAKMDFRYLSTEVIGGFTGVMLGVFTQAQDVNCKGYVDVDWFDDKTIR